MAGDKKKKPKRKKDPNSPDFQCVQPGQKRPTIDMNSQQQPQASASYMYQPYTPSTQQNVPYGQPYYGSPTPPPVPQMPPIPISPLSSQSQPQTQNVLSQDIVAKLFERLDMMDKKLGQLESIQISLQNVTVKVNSMDTKVTNMETQLKDLERSREYDSKTIESMQGRQREIDAMIRKMQKIEEEQKERLIDLQSRQMRDNLIFYNIHDEREESGEACAEKVMLLFEQNLRLKNAREIRLDRVHRLGRYDATKNRPIIAKFCYYQDRERVRKSARNLDGSQYSISQQFPKKILARRKELIPTLKRLKDEGKRAYIAVDKLYVDGRLYKGVLDQPVQQQNSRGTFVRGRARGLSQGHDQGQGHGFGPGQGNAQGGGNGQGQAQGNMYEVLQDEGHDEGQGQMDVEGGQGQGDD